MLLSHIYSIITFPNKRKYTNKHNFLSPSGTRMLVALILVVLCAGIYALFRWLVHSNAQCVLLWHVIITERVLNVLTRKTRPQVCTVCTHRLFVHYGIQALYTMSCILCVHACMQISMCTVFLYGKPIILYALLV